VRLALISDIHGNLPALEAVLSEIEQEGVDEILCLGDVAVGPQPAETLDRVREVGCPVVLGNWDAYFIRGFPAHESEIGRQLVEMGEWWAGHLSDQDRAFIETFTDELKRPGLVAFHGSPRSYEDFIYAATPDAELSQMLDGTRAPMLAGGHTHFAMLRSFDGALVVNPGSVGLPFAKQEAVMRISPWAEYAIVAIPAVAITVLAHRVPSAIRCNASDDTRLPHAALHVQIPDCTARWPKLKSKQN